jgi:uracil phosphoribosyltransferase
MQPVEYYNKLPPNHPYDVCLVLDPMCATGGTAIAAINMLKEWGCKEIKLISVCSCEFGIRAVKTAHPDIEVYVGVVDPELSKGGYIVPGLGDAGDRMFNTVLPH